MIQLAEALMTPMERHGRKQKVANNTATVNQKQLNTQEHELNIEKKTIIIMSQLTGIQLFSESLMTLLQTQRELCTHGFI